MMGSTGEKSWRPIPHARPRHSSLLELAELFLMVFPFSCGAPMP